MISVVIVTLNESKKLEDCLRNVQDFVDEVVVIDLGSSDSLEDIIKKFKGRLLRLKRVEYVELIRQYSINQASNEWILILDPDERLTEELKENLQKVMMENEFVAVNIPRKNIFFKKWIKHTNFWPDRQIRFFKKRYIDWPTIIHAYPKVSGPILDLPADQNLAIIHFGYSTFLDFWERQKRYSKIEAENRFKNGERASLKHFIWLPVREFLVRFIKHKGFLDGFAGIFIVFALMYYKVAMAIKLSQLQDKE